MVCVWDPKSRPPVRTLGRGKGKGMFVSIFFCLSFTTIKEIFNEPVLAFQTFFLTGPPVNNIQIVRKTIVDNSNKTQSSWKRRGSLMPPPLEKYERSGEDTMDGIVTVDPPPFSDVPVYSSFLSADLIDEQVRELQVCVSSVSRKTVYFVFSW